MARDEQPDPVAEAFGGAPEALRLHAALEAAAGRAAGAVRAQLSDARLGWLPAALRRDAQAELLRGGQATERLRAALAAGGAEGARLRRLTTACNGCARAIAVLERRAAQLAVLAGSDLPAVAEAIAVAVQRLRAGALDPAARIERALIEHERELTRSRRKVDDAARRASLDRQLAAATRLVPHVGRLGRWLAGTAAVGVEAVVDEAFGAHGVASPRTVQHALREIAALHGELESAEAVLVATFHVPVEQAERADAAAQRQHALQATLAALLAQTAPLAREAIGLQEALAAAQREVAGARPRSAGSASVQDARALIAASARAAAARRYRVSLGSKSSSTFAPFGS